MKQHYCTIFIVDVLQNPEEVDTITSRIQQLIEDHGGEIVLHNPWGKRRLAYPIQKRTSGFYVEIEFTAPSRLNIPQIIEKEYRLNDRVLRYLTYVVTAEEMKQRKMDSVRKPEEDSRDSRSSKGDKPAGKAATKAEEPKAEEPKAEEPKTEEPKAEETPAEEPKAEEPAAEEKPDETVEEEVIEASEEAETTKDEVSEDETK